MIPHLALVFFLIILAFLVYHTFSTTSHNQTDPIRPNRSDKSNQSNRSNGQIARILISNENAMIHGFQCMTYEEALARKQSIYFTIAILHIHESAIPYLDQLPWYQWYERVLIWQDQQLSNVLPASYFTEKGPCTLVGAGQGSESPHWKLPWCWQCHDDAEWLTQWLKSTS